MSIPAFSDTVRDAVGRMMTIEQTIAEVVTDVKLQEKSYQVIFDALEPWRKLAHVWTAQHFGLDVNADQWQELYTAITTDIPLTPELQALLDEALRLHDEYHFFHWELAFSVVSFDEDGKPIPEGGFDAVVGNPPYVRQERISPYKPFFEANYEIYSGTADLFLYFYERGLELLKADHRVGYITSGTFMNSNSAKSFRQYIHENAAFAEFVDFGAVQPFKGVDLPTVVIIVLERSNNPCPFTTRKVIGRKSPKQLEKSEQVEIFETLQRTTELDEWRFQPKQLTELFERLTEIPVTVREYVDQRIYRGITTGLNDAFIIDFVTYQQLIDKDTSSTEIIKPMIRGSDLRP